MTRHGSLGTKLLSWELKILHWVEIHVGLGGILGSDHRLVLGLLLHDIKANHIQIDWLIRPLWVQIHLLVSL